MPAKIRFYKEAKSGITTPAAGYITLFTGSDALIPDGTGTLNHLTAIDSSGNQLVIPYLDEALTNYRGLAFKGDVDMNSLLTMTSTTASEIGRMYLGSTGLTATKAYKEIKLETRHATINIYNHLLEDTLSLTTTGITYTNSSLHTATYGNTHISLSNGTGNTASIMTDVTTGAYEVYLYDSATSNSALLTTTGLTIAVSGTSQLSLSSQGVAGPIVSNVSASGFTLASNTTGVSGFTGPSTEILTTTVVVTSAQTGVLDSYHNRITLVEAPGADQVLDVITVMGKFNYLGNATGDQPYSANTNLYIVSSGTTATTYMHEGAMFYAPTFLSGTTGSGSVYSKFIQPPIISFPSVSTDKATNLTNMAVGQPIMIATQGTPDGQGSPVANYDNFAINVVYRKTIFKPDF
jgi:hypothetical protein